MRLLTILTLALMLGGSAWAGDVPRPAGPLRPYQISWPIPNVFSRQRACTFFFALISKSTCRRRGTIPLLRSPRSKRGLSPFPGGSRATRNCPPSQAVLTQRGTAPLSGRRRRRSIRPVRHAPWRTESFDRGASRANWQRTDRIESASRGH